MTTPRFFAYPKQGEVLQQQFWYSQSVRVGDQIKVSGQGISLSFALSLFLSLTLPNQIIS